MDSKVTAITRIRALAVVGDGVLGGAAQKAAQAAPRRVHGRDRRAVRQGEEQLLDDVLGVLRAQAAPAHGPGYTVSQPDAPVETAATLAQMAVAPAGMPPRPATGTVIREPAPITPTAIP